MRITTYLGLILGIGIIYAVVVAKGGDYTIFTNVTALGVCLGGTLSATTLSSSRTTALHAAAAMRFLLLSPMVTGSSVTAALVQLARVAKKSGVSALRQQDSPLRDVFFLKGLQLVADGVVIERVEALLRLESEILSEKRRAAERMFRLMGTYSPMFGLVGTLIGLISMLKGLSDPRAIGQGMSVALMATFYGVLLAGLVFLPLAAKVRTLDGDERLLRDQMLAGLLAIGSGDNPENIRETQDVFTQKSSAA